MVQVKATHRARCLTSAGGSDTTKLSGGKRPRNARLGWPGGIRRTGEYPALNAMCEKWYLIRDRETGLFARRDGDWMPQSHADRFSLGEAEDNVRFLQSIAYICHVVREDWKPGHEADRLSDQVVRLFRAFSR